MFQGFERLQDLENKIFKIDIIEIEGLVLHCRPATADNVEYRNMLLETNSGKKLLDIGKRGKGVLNSELIDMQRKEDREIYPLCIIVGWTGLFDNNGDEVLFSTENAKKLVEQIPDWLLDKIRARISSHTSLLNNEQLGN